jgi:hypothetical protein
MVSQGNAWRLVMPDGTPWSTLKSGGEALGILVDVASAQQGYGMTYPEIWDLCKLVPSFDPKEGWIVGCDYWQGSVVLAMLREAERAGREELK